MCNAVCPNEADKAAACLRRGGRRGAAQQAAAQQATPLVCLGSIVPLTRKAALTGEHTLGVAASAGPEVGAQQPMGSAREAAGLGVGLPPPSSALRFRPAAALPGACCACVSCARRAAVWVPAGTLKNSEGKSCPWVEPWQATSP